MSRSVQISTVLGRIQTQAAVKVLAAILLVLGLTGTALAIDQPPETAPQQRAWLLSHLVTDMQSAGTFQSTDIAQMVSLLNSLSDDQVSLLARFYYLTRAKSEQDARLYAVQQNDGDEALAQAKTQIADVLSQLQVDIQQTYSQLVTVNPGCQTLCQFSYASVPGWFFYNQYAIPDWYYGGGCFVGPVYSSGYCGSYAAPLYDAFYNRGGGYNCWNSQTYINNNYTKIKTWNYYNHNGRSDYGKFSGKHGQQGGDFKSPHKPYDSFKQGKQNNHNSQFSANRNNRSPMSKNANSMTGAKQSKNNSPLSMKHGNPPQKSSRNFASTAKQPKSLNHGSLASPKSLPNYATHATPQPKQAFRAPMPSASSRPQQFAHRQAQINHSQPRPQHASQPPARQQHSTPASSVSGRGRHK